MKLDIRHYAVLRRSLENERDALRARLAELVAVLGDAGDVPAHAPARPAPRGARQSSQPARATRPVNKLTMRDAIQQASARAPMGIRDLVPAMQKLGYKFASKNPVNSLGAYLYGPAGKEYFKKVEGGFISK